MIDEDRLRGLLAEAAEAAPAPGRGPEGLLAGLSPGPEGGVAQDRGGDRSGPGAPSARRRRPSRVLAVAAAVVVALVAVGVGAGLGDDTSRSGSELAAVPSQADGDRAVDRDEGARDGGGELGDGSVGATSGAGGAAAPPAAPTAGSAQASPGPVDGAKVVKTGSLEVEVPEGAFDAAITTVTRRAAAVGGYVAESSTGRSGDAPSGTVTVRVPSGAFDGFVEELRGLGDVQAVSTRGVEVSAQHTDLEARLAAVTATRDRLSAVLAEADDVGEILAVQDRITQVQTEIEQLQGQLRLLEDQTAMGTLTVSVVEPGGRAIHLTGPDDRGLGGAWDEARERFGNGVEAVVAWSGSAAVVLLFGALALGLGRLLWSRYRRWTI